MSSSLNSGSTLSFSGLVNGECHIAVLDRFTAVCGGVNAENRKLVKVDVFLFAGVNDTESHRVVVADDTVRGNTGVQENFKKIRCGVLIPVCIVIKYIVDRFAACLQGFLGTFGTADRSGMCFWPF